MYSGAPNVFSKPKIGYDNKFFDEFYPPVNIWYKYDNQPLKKSIGEFVTEPIATCYSEHNYEQSNEHNTIFKQPRLLLVSVDIEEGTSVVFDSYSKDKHVDKRYSNYKSEVIGKDKKNNIEKIIKYDKGITVDHIIASASVPINYDYTILEVDVHPSRYINTNNNISNNKHKGYFWDGGLLSNSPLRELIQAHRDYWLMMNNISTVDNGLKANKKTEKNYEESENKKTPDLDLYIVDVHPSKNYDVSFDRDGVLNRNLDITFHNRNLYDIKVANIIGDYVDLAKLLIEKAKETGSKKDIDKILTQTTGKSKSRSGESRKYIDLLEGRFKINKIKHFERKNDKNVISNKAFDFSTQTIKQLIEDGYNETKMNLSK